ncbi:AAA family ATPase [Chryseobacterium sp. KACC 21268]|nr:AAA family ATPase [Chryseobacterium sp. KACC 21268]
MSTIILKKMILVNFKGVRNLTIDFDSNTNIFGNNGTGKTTIFDAFTWMLFGKDSTDRKDFEIKTLDENNQVIPKIEHEVYGEILVDGNLVTVKRTFREKWVKTKGALEAEFSGNETLYYWNEVPLSMKEYGNKVSEILDESVFKLITSPSAFNALKWQDRRNALIKIVGDISDKELAGSNSDYLDLLSQLTNKTLDEYKKQILSTIKKMKDDIKMIPTRIDEVERGKPQPVDAESVNAEIALKEQEIISIDNQLQDKAAAHDEITQKRNANQDEIYRLKSAQNAIRFEISEAAKLENKSDTSKADGLKRQINEKEQNELLPAQQKLARLKTEKKDLNADIQRYETAIIGKREEWNNENAKVFTFDDENATCPTCGHAIEANDLEVKRKELQEKFNTDKTDRLAQISAEGKKFANANVENTNELAGLETRITSGEEYIKTLEGQIAQLRADLVIENSTTKESVPLDVIISQKLEGHSEYKSLASDIAEREAKEFKLPEGEDNSELKIAKATLQNEISDLKSTLQVNSLIKIANDRITALQSEESKLAQEISNIEKTQYIIDNFIKLKIDTIESRINEKFSYVKFKLFETQINGGQIECCEALINGVPFSDANTASKINAGIDIINTLCEFYQVSAPIFIDNRESVVKLIPSESQIINLIVSEDDKKLRVS